MSQLWPDIAPQLSLSRLRHSVDDDLGESDLIVVHLDSASGRYLASLIENEINAKSQPDQAPRHRGERGHHEWVVGCVLLADDRAKGLSGGGLAALDAAQARGHRSQNAHPCQRKNVVGSYRALR